MKLDAAQFRLPADGKIDLAKAPTRVDPFYDSKSAYADILAKHVEKLGALQERLYVSRRNALLVIFQGLDSAGKDGSIAHVTQGVNPQGCTVTGFRAPTENEFRHDFLWRVAAATPARGMIGVFNRSHYESVLITRVHPELLRREGYDTIPDDPDAVWAERLRSIRDFERHLHANGTRIVKIFLHVSREEQRKRLLQRLETPEKSWKASLADVQERKYFKEYWRAYERAFAATHAPHAPWHVVPADDKPNARLAVSEIVVEALEALNLEPPAIDAARRKELEAIREALKE